MPDEIERIHKEVLGFERIETISDSMRGSWSRTYGRSWSISCRQRSRRA